MGNFLKSKAAVSSYLLIRLSFTDSRQASQSLEIPRLEQPYSPGQSEASSLTATIYICLLSTHESSESRGEAVPLSFLRTDDFTA